MAVTAAAVCSILGLWIALELKPARKDTITATPPPPVIVDTIAVMTVADDGTLRLEEVEPSQLGSIELAFGITPVISKEAEEW